MTELGGFFASLKLKSDAASFAQGKKQLDDVAKSAKGLKQEYNTASDSIIEKTMKMGASFLGLAGAIGKMAVGLEVALASMGVMSAKSAAQLSTQGFKANMSASTANRWSLVAKLAGGSSEGLLGEMGNVNQTLQKVKFGDAEAYSGLLKSLSFMGLTQNGAKAFAETGKTGNVDELVKAIMTWSDKESKAGRAQSAYTNVLEALGPEFANLVAQGSIGEKKGAMGLYANAGSISMRTGQGLDVSTKTNQRLNALGADWDQVTGSLGDKINKVLYPELVRLDEWFKTHKDDIEKWTTMIAGAFEGMLNAFKALAENPAFQFLANAVGTVAGETTKGLGGKEGVVRNVVDAASYGFLRGESDPRKSAYDIGIAFPSMFGNSSELKTSQERANYAKMEEGYKTGKEFTLNVVVDGKTQTYKIDPSKGTETLTSAGSKR